MTGKIVKLTIQKWGNSLAVRIPSSIAKIAHFYQGTVVELNVQDNNLLVTATGERKMTLDERLKLFDPQMHGGEAMASERMGLEKF